MAAAEQAARGGGEQDEHNQQGGPEPVRHRTVSSPVVLSCILTV
jgi:hypothetical protein